MGYYTGFAVVVDQNGAEYDVHASLRSRTETSWSGSLSGDVPWSELFEAGQAMTIRIGDREGSVIVKSRGVAARKEAPVPVQGAGIPPFD